MTAKINSKTAMTRKERAAYSAALLQQSAFEIIAESGLKALTMDTLSKRAGVSRGLPRYYFGSKDNLLRSLFRKIEFDTEQILPTNLSSGQQNGIKGVCIAIEAIKARIQHNPVTVKGVIKLLNEASATESLNLQKEAEHYSNYLFQFFEHLLLQKFDATESKELAWLIVSTFRGTLSTWVANPASPDVLCAFDQLTKLLKSKATHTK